MKSILACAILALPLLSSCSKKEEPAATPPAPAETAAAAAPGTDPGNPPETPPAAATDRVKLSTNHGDIVIQLDREKAPRTVENFLSYVSSKHYDGTVFHRVIDGFMIQGGGFAVSGSRIVEKPTGNPIPNEGKNGLKNDRGTIAMARTSDPNSATAQFYINVSDNISLNYPGHDGHGYAVFGKVIEGMDVVDKIRAVATGTKPLTMLTPAGEQAHPAADVPNETVVIESATVVGAD